MPNLLGIDIDGQTIGKILNSRIGLVLIFIAYTSSPWGLGAKIDALVRNSDKVATAIEQTRETGTQNHDILTRLIDRCEVSTPAMSRRDRTALKPDKGVRKITE